MADDAKLVVEVAGDSRSYDRTLRRTETETKAWARRLEGITAGSMLGTKGGLGGTSALLKGGGLALGLGIAAGEARELAQAASDLHEQVSKTQVVFGSSAASVENWSRTLARSFGISETAGLEAAGTFGAIFHNTGQTQADAAKLSERVVELASDLASFNNTSTDDALLALRSGLSGEIEPLRRFQVFLTEAAVANEAMRESGKTNVAQLTQGEKIMARYRLILQQTAIQQGDFGRTSQGAANQQRILSAQVDNAKATLGKGLLPVLVLVTSELNDAFEAAGILGGALKDLGVEGHEVGNVLKAAFLATPGLGAQIASIKLLTHFFGEAETQIDNTAQAAKDFESVVPNLLDTLTRKPVTPKLPAFGEPGFRTVKPEETLRLGTTAEQRNQFFDAGLARRLDRVQDISTIQGQISALRGIAATIEQRIAVTKDITRRLNLEDQLVGVRRESRSLGDQLVADAAERRRQQKALADQQAATKLAQRTARQFRELGLDAGGDVITPGVDNLKKRLAQITSNITGTTLDTPKLEAQLKRFRKVLSEGLVPKDVRAKIRDMLDDISDELNKGNDELKTKTTSINADAVFAGLGLGADARRALRSRLSAFNSGGQGLANRGALGAFGVPLTGDKGETVIHTTINIDGQKVATTITRHQDKAAKRNPKQKRGVRRL